MSENKDYSQKQQENINNPSKWMWRAEEFRYATYVLCKDTHPDRAYLLHAIDYNAALSLELIAKSILLVKNGGLKQGNLSHKITVLFKEADIRLNEHQAATLEYYESVLLWFGRYPTPHSKKANDAHRKHEQASDKLFKPHSTIDFAEQVNNDTVPTWENYSQLWETAMNEYTAAGGPKPLSFI